MSEQAGSHLALLVERHRVTRGVHVAPEQLLETGTTPIQGGHADGVMSVSECAAERNNMGIEGGGDTRPPPVGGAMEEADAGS